MNINNKTRKFHEQNPIVFPGKKGGFTLISIKTIAAVVVFGLICTGAAHLVFGDRQPNPLSRTKEIVLPLNRVVEEGGDRTLGGIE